VILSSFSPSTMADPVADRSGFLCTYMSSHPDTLVAYAKHFGKVDGNVSSAKMLSINSKVRTGGPHHTTRGQVVSRLLFQGMDLEYKIKDASGRPQVVRVEFDPPLRGYEEVKPRLLGMKADADEALGTVRDRSPRSLVFPLPFSPRGPPSPRTRQRRRLCHVIRSYPARAIYI
jgi:hypothetical protein